MSFKSLPNNKILVQSKALADDKINVTQKNLLLEGYKTFWEKGENDGYQPLLLFPKCFQKPSDFMVANSPFPKKALVFMCLQYKFFENREKEKLLFMM